MLINFVVVVSLIFHLERQYSLSTPSSGQGTINLKNFLLHFRSVTGRNLYKKSFQLPFIIMFTHVFCVDCFRFIPVHNLGGVWPLGQCGSLISFAYNRHLPCHHVTYLISFPMVYVSCLWCWYFMSYGTFYGNTSLAYCCHCILLSLILFGKVQK